MQFGAIIYELRAERAGRLPLVHGHLLHAALFAALREASPSLAEAAHAAWQKPFALSPLQWNAARQAGDLAVEVGATARWRVVGFGARMLEALLFIPVGHVFQIGTTPFSLRRLTADAREEAAAGLTDTDALIADCAAEGFVQRIAFQFKTPTTFRSFQRDYPFPLPDFLWGSLCDKWNCQGDERAALDAAAVRQVAAGLLPLDWRGRTERLYFSRKRGTLGFCGQFSFSLAELSKEWNSVFFLLARFAFFSGVGRLTAQGMGQTRVYWPNGEEENRK